MGQLFLQHVQPLAKLAHQQTHKSVSNALEVFTTSMESANLALQVAKPVTQPLLQSALHAILTPSNQETIVLLAIQTVRPAKAVMNLQSVQAVKMTSI